MSAKPEPTPEPQQEERRYCLCRKPYEEDKVMIACDRCDEWYHPACVSMPEVEVDLVDMFICEKCATSKWRTLSD
ncbi:hypothetical protein BU17DRAFT_51126 [Hysterangium stoloniferum]|nr:hypothetical protein BU17DRAFT_51126 [Hysterangium stoloniferum]